MVEQFLIDVLGKQLFIPFVVLSTLMGLMFMIAGFAWLMSKMGEHCG